MKNRRKSCASALAKQLSVIAIVMNQRAINRARL
jgi:hypothetical protein